MAKVLSFSQALKGLLAIIFVAVLVPVAGKLSDSLIAEHASTASRWLGVLVAVVSLVPWMAFIAWVPTVADEFQRQVFVAGTAIAFAANVLVHVAFAVMQDARLVSWSTHLVELPTAVIVWMLSVGVVALYYRFRL